MNVNLQYSSQHFIRGILCNVSIYNLIFMCKPGKHVIVDDFAFMIFLWHYFMFSRSSPIHPQGDQFSLLSNHVILWVTPTIF